MKGKANSESAVSVLWRADLTSSEYVIPIRYKTNGNIIAQNPKVFAESFNAT